MAKVYSQSDDDATWPLYKYDAATGEISNMAAIKDKLVALDATAFTPQVVKVNPLAYLKLTNNILSEESRY